MKTGPVLFNAEMVRAVLEDRKTVTRRLNRLAEVNENPDAWRLIKNVGIDGKGREVVVFVKKSGFGEVHVPCDLGSVETLLWVRCTWKAEKRYDHLKPIDIPQTSKIWFEATGYLDVAEPQYAPGKTRPSIFLPRWASRILIEVVSVKVERVQSITEDGAKAEGVYSSGWVPSFYDPDNASMSPSISAKENFATLWDSINAKRGYGWNLNPWVWVVEFKRVEG